MKLIKTKLFLVSLLSILLAACATSADKPEENAVEAESNETNENVTENSILADEITTTFDPEATKLRVLTEEDEAWYDIIMPTLNAIDDHSGDRETVYEIAEEYGEDPEDLYENWLEIVNAKFYGDMGEYALLPDDFSELEEEIINKNIVGDRVVSLGGGFSFDDEALTSNHHTEVEVDGKTHKVGFTIEYEDNYKVAEITSFRVDGEEIDL